jgi:N6-adenosine-specific RNA methylase IME4
MATEKSTSLSKIPVSLPARVAADRVVTKLREAERALQFVTTIHQAKIVADVAAAQELFAHRQRLGDEIENYAHQIKTYALAKLGELLAAMPKAKGGQPYQGRARSTGSTVVPVGTLAELGLDKKTSAIAQQLAALPAPVRESIAAREVTMAEAFRQVKATTRRSDRIATIQEAARGNTALRTADRYPIVYADPPWRYEHVKTESRAIENQYPTMSLDEICALPVGDMTTEDAVLFLWATSPKLSESMRVVESWGFTYRTCAVWVKDQIGMGYYFRQRHEMLLVATKGSPPVPEPADRPDSVIESPREEHSRKPDAFYLAIERMYPSLPKIELFARGARKGWARWGNQAA